MPTLPSRIYYDHPLPTGMRIGQLTVIGWKFHKDYRDLLIHIMRCDCGRIVNLSQYALQLLLGGLCNPNCEWHHDIYQGVTGVITHGDSRSRLYRIFRGMLQRCRNRKSMLYRYYGGRGISVCDEWRNNYHAFKVWAVNHGYRDNLSIDRIDNDGNYEPGNCRWATAKEQNNNKSHPRHYRKRIKQAIKNP